MSGELIRYDCMVDGMSSGRGFVYLIASGSLVKIGWSMNPFVRIQKLRTGNGREIALVSFIAGSREVEARLHRRYKDRRIRGEWFDDSSGDIAQYFADLVALGKLEVEPA